jgi:outer membrane protein OmpA-like peptidoglycan-associated protein
MNRSKRTMIATLALATVLLFGGGLASAQTQQVKGVINGRSGATLSVQTRGSGNVVVVLNDYTQVEDVSGIFHARRKQMGVTVLEPGLQVQVDGNYNAQNQFVANTVKFNSKDLQNATDIQAGVAPVEQQEQVQQQQAATQEAQIQQQEQAMAKQQQEMAAAQAKIAANQAAIAAVNKRFGELADYNIWDEVTVYFGNDKVLVDEQYSSPLLALCQKALTVTGYVIQVKGYASAVGAAALNQKLSQERAANVTDFLEQQCQIPLTNVLAPGAMGTSTQIAPNSTVEGQAENRRVVVRVLQNKGIAGTQAGVLIPPRSSVSRGNGPGSKGQKLRYTNFSLAQNIGQSNITANGVGNCIHSAPTSVRLHSYRAQELRETASECPHGKEQSI